MEFILEWKNYYQKGDIVLISYWYNQMITPVVIKDILPQGYLVSHNTPESKIQNAPQEKIFKKDIISKSPYVRLKS